MTPVLFGWLLLSPLLGSVALELDGDKEVAGAVVGIKLESTVVLAELLDGVEVV